MYIHLNLLNKGEGTGAQHLVVSAVHVVVEVASAPQIVPYVAGGHVPRRPVREIALPQLLAEHFRREGFAGLVVEPELAAETLT